MPSIKQTWTAMNGKKLPIALIIACAAALTGYGQVKAKVDANCADIKDLKPLVAQTAVIEATTNELKEDFLDFRTEQRSVNERHADLMMKIYDKVK